MKRREKDNAKRAQSRKWYFEKADWIVSDEIEDENGDEAMEEEEAKEEEVPISTVPFVEGRNKVCPVCREEFSQFFKQVITIFLKSHPNSFLSEWRWQRGGGMVSSQRHGV